MRAICCWAYKVGVLGGQGSFEELEPAVWAVALLLSDKAHSMGALVGSWGPIDPWSIAIVNSLCVHVRRLEEALNFNKLFVVLDLFNGSGLSV